MARPRQAQKRPYKGPERIRRNLLQPLERSAHFREEVCEVLQRRPDVVSFLLMLTLSVGLAGLSHVAGFSAVAATLVGAATATVGWWASATEP